MRKKEFLAPEPPKGCKRPPRVTPPMLVNEIARLFHSRMRSFDAEGGSLRDSERLILHALEHTDGCSQLDLVRCTHLKAPTVSVSLRNLEDDGFVVRKQDEMDQRVTHVFLSEQGRAHNERIKERLKKVDASLMQGFSEEESTQLIHFLERMRDNILSETAPKNT